MTDERFSSDTHRYLDGEPVDLITDDERALADRLNEAVASYARGLEVPGPEVDRAVMAVISSPARRRSFWRWFVASHVVMVRPALAAAAVIAIIAFSSLVSMRTFIGSNPLGRLRRAATRSGPYWCASRSVRLGFSG